MLTDEIKEKIAKIVQVQQEIFNKEKELVAIIEPEEYRLQCIEDEAKAYAIKQERERKWPERLERLKELEYKGGSSDDHVLKMLSDVEFETYINNVKAKIEAEALARQRTEQLAREADLKRKRRLLKRRPLGNFLEHVAYILTRKKNHARKFDS